jgi:pimeloyl-ACP methyl ester carboxylesterase
MKLALAELARASVETSSLFASAPLAKALPRGEPHDVVVSPGFACSQLSTLLLRSFIASLGYRVHDWGLGRNLGARTVGASGERLVQRVEEISQGGANPVTLVGHSLGGVMSRAYALERPGAVRQVICLGSPFVGDPRAVNRWVLGLHDRLSGAPAGPPPSKRPAPLETPFTAIYSQTDGIVAASDTSEARGPRAEAIEVYSSHIGLVAHPAVFYAVADRLAQAPHDWRPFAPRRLVRAWYGRIH